MLITRLLWLHVTMMFLICFFNSNAVYPVPGSYYSVLLRYNNRGKNRKGARIGPSPLRLWAYFDPPSVLGSLALGAIDNNLEVHNRKRSVWASQERAKKTNENGGVPSPEEAEKIRDQIKTVQLSPLPMSTENLSIRSKARPIYSDHKKYNLNFENSDAALNKDAASCGGNEKVILDPYNYAPDSGGRFFHKIIQTIGYPHFYEPQAKCIWNFHIGRECQMGMIVVEFLEGTLISSSQCHLDSINILFNGESKKKTCGSMNGIITSLKWTKTGKQLVQIALESKSEENTFQPGRKWGAKITLSGYCWVYAPHFLTQSFAGIKGKENPKRDPVKVSEVDDKNPHNIDEIGISATDIGYITINEKEESITSSSSELTKENNILTTVNPMITESDIQTEIYEITTIDETWDLKNEFTVTDIEFQTTEISYVTEPENEVPTVTTTI